MNKVFVIQNNEGRFWSKQDAWCAPDEPGTLYRSTHRDEAINELFELTTRDITLRARVVEVSSTSRGAPLVDDVPLPEFSGDTSTPQEETNETP